MAVQCGCAVWLCSVAVQCGCPIPIHDPNPHPSQCFRRGPRSSPGFPSLLPSTSPRPPPRAASRRPKSEALRLSGERGLSEGIVVALACLMLLSDTASTAPAPAPAQAPAPAPAPATAPAPAPAPAGLRVARAARARRVRAWPRSNKRELANYCRCVFQRRNNTHIHTI